MFSPGHVLKMGVELGTVTDSPSGFFWFLSHTKACEGRVSTRRWEFGRQNLKRGGLSGTCSCNKKQFKLEQSNSTGYDSQQNKLTINTKQAKAFAGGDADREAANSFLPGVVNLRDFAQYDETVVRPTFKHTGLLRQNVVVVRKSHCNIIESRLLVAEALAG